MSIETHELLSNFVTLHYVEQIETLEKYKLFVSVFFLQIRDSELSHNENDFIPLVVLFGHLKRLKFCSIN